MKELLINRVPAQAVDYCVALHDETPFNFKLSPNRISKLGDYRYNSRTGTHAITVNVGLNPYRFLITYVHEVAHRRAYHTAGRQKPHGPAWKKMFQQLMLPLLRPEIFPNEILRVLARHMKNPRAGTSADALLLETLAKYDPMEEEKLTLRALRKQDIFTFRNRNFQKLDEKRTRAVCLDLNNRKRYLIPMVVKITKVNG